MTDKCFACDRPLTEGYLVGCADEQDVGVGPECYAKIRKSGAGGYQPPLGGPRLYLLEYAYQMRRSVTPADATDAGSPVLTHEKGK